MLTFEKTVLPNKLRILTAPLHETKAMTLLFLVGTGSRYETRGVNGISHFLEHILFKGTKQYPSPLAIAETLDGIGAEFNAYTSEEYTGYYVQAEASHFDLALNVLHDMLWAPIFKKQDVEREKGVIVEEINMYRDLPQRHVWDLLKQTLYGDTPLGWNVAGSRETVTGFTRTTFQDYQAAFYTPDNVIAAVAGNPNEHDWLKELTGRLSAHTGAIARQFEGVIEHADGPKALVEHRPTDQTHLVLALPTFKKTDDRAPILLVANTILGGTMSSRLFTEIREQRGLAYYVRSSVDASHDTGFLALSAGVRNSSAKEAVTVMLAELKKIAAQPVTAQELERAKENFRGRMALQLEDSSALAGYLAEQELYWGTQFQPEELVEKVQVVTTSQIHELMSELFTPAKLHLAAIGPFTNQDFLSLLK